MRKIAERRGPWGLYEYFADENDNVYVSKNYSDLELLGRIELEPSEGKYLFIDDICIDLETVNFSPPQTLPYPEEVRE